MNYDITVHKLPGTAEGNCNNAELIAAAEVGDVALVEDLLQCPGIDVNVQNQGLNSIHFKTS